MKTFIAFHALALIATAAFAQGAGSTDPAAFAEATQKALVQQYCERDGHLMQCLGVDIRKEGARCAELVRRNWAFCKSTFLMTSPASIPQADSRSYVDSLAGCARSGAITAAGKSESEVDTCMANAR